MVGLPGEGFGAAIGSFFDWLSGSNKRKLRQKLTSSDEYVRITEPLIKKYVIKGVKKKSKLLKKKLKLLIHHKKRIRAY